MVGISLNIVEGIIFLFFLQHSLRKSEVVLIDGEQYDNIVCAIGKVLHQGLID